MDVQRKSDTRMSGTKDQQQIQRVTSDLRVSDSHGLELSACHPATKTCAGIFFAKKLLKLSSIVVLLSMWNYLHYKKSSWLRLSDWLKVIKNGKDPDCDQLLLLLRIVNWRVDYRMDWYCNQRTHSPRFDYKHAFWDGNLQSRNAQ